MSETDEGRRRFIGRRGLEGEIIDRSGVVAPMTAPTPEQMRALADRAEILQEDSDYDYVFVTNVIVALRAAADQLDWLRDYVENNWAHGKFTERGMYLPLVDAGPLLKYLTNGEQR